MSMLDAALDLADSRRFAVFPCGVNAKEPAIARGF